MTQDKTITQLSIFINNEPGRLACVMRTIKSAGIFIKAFNLSESAEFGILRAVVDDPDTAYEKLTEKGVIVRKTEIIAVAIPEAADSFYTAAEALGEEGVNIEYGYFYSGPKGSVMFFRVDDTGKAETILEKAGIRLMDDGEFRRWGT